LTGVKDLFNGELVSYAMNERMTKDLVIQALFHTTASKHPGNGLIDHSDCSNQYCVHDYQNLLQQFGMIASMSRKGDCYDNTPMESFWGILKTELVRRRKFKTRHKPVRRLPNISRSSITDCANKKDLGYIAHTIYAATLRKSTRCLNQWTPFLEAHIICLDLRKLKFQSRNVTLYFRKYEYQSSQNNIDQFHHERIGDSVRRAGRFLRNPLTNPIDLWFASPDY